MTLESAEEGTDAASSGGGGGKDGGVSRGFGRMLWGLRSGRELETGRKWRLVFHIVERVDAQEWAE